MFYRLFLIRLLSKKVRLCNYYTYERCWLYFLKRIYLRSLVDGELKSPVYVTFVGLLKGTILLFFYIVVIITYKHYLNNKGYIYEALGFSCLLLIDLFICLIYCPGSQYQKNSEVVVKKVCLDYVTICIYIHTYMHIYIYTCIYIL